MSRPAHPHGPGPLASAAAVALLVLTGCSAAHTTSAPTTGATVAGAEAPSSGHGTGAPQDGAAGSTPGNRSAAAPSPSSAPGREQAPTPSAPAAVTLPGIGSADAPAAPLLTGPAPASAQRNGAVVVGFPVQVVPVPKGVTVVSSSVTSQGEHVQLGMQAFSATAPDQVLGAYDAALGANGFTPTVAPALPGTTAHTYLHGADGVVVTVTPRPGGGTEITLAGTLTTTG